MDDCKLQLIVVLGESTSYEWNKHAGFYLGEEAGGMLPQDFLNFGQIIMVQ